ncbi:hypothetical protein [Pseudobacteroides cellulosolvens]|uniref:Uncharacterized protein n=1 Tax=Pseudobacteroides cellulosolvens ATCC 35603 = DSM 2933 TaxID=398512 RepID=A0A0L6JR91_9FIRM|nr:hypothetical protein [Pseudobacteroides cellulosolvens]KNY27907.1 hypothetical protein Bccel_3178 [Pseudobacteroides cellulosolvens ATCC 35603 = DSM 2933]
MESSKNKPERLNKAIKRILGETFERAGFKYDSNNEWVRNNN